ncbi:MBL fold metallo-hydrolase [Winogradskyella sp.]|uniref:MBL fold metallo-hydrolase n=1 Tax=Winogradskyella sp. TaxID=1883156 RepID=UPI003AB6CD76
MKYIKIFMLLIFTILNSSCAKAASKKDANNTAHKERTTIDQSGLTQQKITNNLYVLKNPNYNTNVGVFIGKDAILLIDPMTGNNNQKQLLNAIKQLSKKPIKYVINTHHHMDHSGANRFFKKLGATIISQENAKYSNALYDITFKDSYSLDMGNENIKLYHSTAHTFDDILVYFENNNAVFMGDTFMTNSFPHFYYGGGGLGHLNIIDKALSLGNVHTVIIPAHGKLASNKKELSVYRENSVQWISSIKSLFNEGKTSEEIAENVQIKKLSTIFNNGRNVSKQSIQRTINKTISVDLVVSKDLSEKTLKNYEGIYEYENGQVDEIIYQNKKLLFRSKGKYIYEITPLSEIKFHIKGQFPNKYLVFKNSGNEFEFFNGKKNLIAKRK